jgi:hypothetical protein
MSDNPSGENKGVLHPTERFEDRDEAARQESEARQSQMWTALPVIIQKHDRDKNTVHVNPAVKLNHLKDDGTNEWLQIAKMEDLPVLYYGGGGASVTVPLKEGDEALAIVASRSIDKWWKEGGVQEQLHSRMHDISDSFILPGFRSQKRVLKNVSEKTWQLRNEDGKSYVEFDPGDNPNYTIHVKDKVTIESIDGQITVKAKGPINMESAGKVTIKGSEIILDGTVRLGGADATIEVAKKGTVDTRGDALVSNFARGVFTK